MQIRVQIAFLLAGLASVGTHARPCDESTSPISTSTYYTPYPSPSYYTRSRHGHHHYTSVITETVTIPTTISRTLTRVSTQTQSQIETVTIASATTYTDTYTPTTTSSSSSRSYSSVFSGTPTPTPSASSGGQCNTGPVQCCDSVQNAGSPAASNILQGLALAIGASVPVGLTCTPLNVLGGGSGANCASTPVCCENNTYNGLINIGCVPIVLQS